MYTDYLKKKTTSEFDISSCCVRTCKSCLPILLVMCDHLYLCNRCNTKCHLDFYLAILPPIV